MGLLSHFKRESEGIGNVGGGLSRRGLGEKERGLEKVGRTSGRDERKEYGHWTEGEWKEGTEGGNGLKM